MNSAVCVICVKPEEIWCNFLENFTNYDIFIVLDDEQFDLSEFKLKYKNINFIQIKAENCGCFRCANVIVGSKVSGWDKAIYFFCSQSYKKVWIIENDVFLYNENTLISLDRKFPEQDLLSREYSVNKNGYRNYWHWNHAGVELEPPWYNTMVCIIRTSNNLLKCINNYVNKYNKLIFIEALFPTIAIKNNLTISTPNEFNKIHWRHNFSLQDIQKSHLHHPVKNLNDHLLFRDHLKFENI